MLRHVQPRLFRSTHAQHFNAMRALNQETQRENAPVNEGHGTQGDHLDSFEEHFKKHHIPTNFFQKTLLGLGAGLMALYDPHRGDMIATMGETTGYNAIQYIRERMESCEEGQRILRERPRINSKTVDLEKLKTYPAGTFGKTYSDFLIRNNVTPDARLSVQFVDDLESAYVMQRYREVHDLFHAVLEMPTNMLGECTVKWVEAIQTRLPMCVSGALFGGVRLKPKHRELYVKYHLPWAIDTAYNIKSLMNIYYEKRWEQPVEEFHREIGYKPLLYPKVAVSSASPASKEKHTYFYASIMEHL